METHGTRRFRLEVDMQCRCMGCIRKFEKAMASIGSSVESKTSVADVDAGIVAVAGKVDPMELCQWLKRKTRKDVKIVGSDHNQKMILVLGSSSRTGDTTPSAPTLPDHLSWALAVAPSGIQSDDEDLQLIEEKIRDLEKARDTLKIKNLKNELITAKCELKQSREVISNGKKALLDSALNQLKAYKKLEALSQSLCD